MLRNFVYNVCGCAGDWKMDSFVENSVKALREKIGDGKVLLRPVRRRGFQRLCGCMLAKAIGKQLTCVFVDHGLLRKNEGDAGLRGLWRGRPVRHQLCLRRCP